VAVVVGARGLGAAASTLALAGVWLGLVVLVPALVNLTITTLAPMPSRVEATIRTRQATNEAVVQGSALLGAFLQDHPTSARVGREGLRQFALLEAARDAEVLRRLAPVTEALERQQERQRRLTNRLSWLSPTMVAQLAMVDVAGTGPERHRHLRGEVERFRDRWRAHFEPRILAVAALTPDDYRSLPAPALEDEPLGAAIGRNVPATLFLGLAGALLLAVGLARYRKYDVCG
jgi:ABC-2 type transport system permease protein